MNDLSNLEAKARAATQGEWSVEPHGSARALYSGRDDQHHGLRLLNLDDGDRNISDNAAYIVAAQPSVVLELIERIRAAEAKAGEPVAWVLPVSAASDARIAELEAEVERLRAQLQQSSPQPDYEARVLSALVQP